MKAWLALELHVSRVPPSEVDDRSKTGTVVATSAYLAGIDVAEKNCHC